MRPTIVTLTIGRDSATAEFNRSEDCGYSQGRLILDLPCGDSISIGRSGRKWIETRIRPDRIARGEPIVHDTKREAMESAAMDFLFETVQAESIHHFPGVSQ